MSASKTGLLGNQQDRFFKKQEKRITVKQQNRLVENKD